MPVTIVIGMGISASAYLATVRKSLGRVNVLGGSHLWRQLDPHHRMGQSVPLLTGNLLGRGRGYRSYEDPHAQGGRGFMLARDFAEMVDDQIQRHSHAQLPGSLVTAIRPSTLNGFTYEVEANVHGDRLAFPCHNVIVASGPGPLRALGVGEDGKLEVDVRQFRGYVVGGNEFLSPEWRMPPGQEVGEGKMVAVYGGSATASWAVEMAALRGMRVVRWFTRPGTGDGAWDTNARFRDAFPPGQRNTQVQQAHARVRAVLRLLEIKLIQPRHTEPFLLLKFSDEAGDTVLQAVDLLVYALGAEHSQTQGIFTMISPSLRQGLVAYYDRNQAISARRSLLAIGTEDGSLMIVGAAMSSAAGFGRSNIAIQGDPTQQISSLAKYTDMASTLPPAARPAEGIAMVMAGVEALNEHMPVRAVPGRYAMFSGEQGDNLHEIDFRWDINFNTSNRTQLAAYFAQATDLDPFEANLTVAMIVHLRSRTQQVFGLTEQQLRDIVRTTQLHVAALRRRNPHFEDIRRWDEDGQGVDRVLEICVANMTTSQAWIAYWGHHGLRC
jgi:hypothetical protein